MNFNFVLQFAKFDGLSWIKRAPWTVVGYSAMPLALLFLIYILSGGKLVGYAVAGGLVATISTTSIMIAGSSAVFRIQLRLQELLVATRIDRMEYMLGFAIANLIFCIPGLVIYAGLGIYFGFFTPLTVLVTMAVLFMLTIAIIAIAFFMGSIFRNINSVWTTASMLGVILTMLPPTYYPYTLLPTPVLYVLSLSPVTPAAVLLQGYYGLAPVNNYMFIILGVETIAYFYIAKRFTRWREN